MATEASGDSNIVDAETINWRLLVYPIAAAVILIVGGFGYYYYQLSQREVIEGQAREALLDAKSPEEMVKVADQFPKTDHAILALLNAANASFEKKAYDAAIQNYQRVISTPDADAQLRDSAQMGLASTLDASGKTDDAIKAFQVLAQRGNDTPFAPAAYMTVARIYEQRGDKTNEESTLVALAGLDPDSAFVKEAQFKLKELNSSAAAQPAPDMTGTVEKK